MHDSTYEYKVELIREETGRALEMRLNRNGNEGWQLVGIRDDSYIFMRSKQSRPVTMRTRLTTGHTENL